MNKEMNTIGVIVIIPGVKKIKCLMFSQVLFGVTLRVLTLLRDPITGHITDDSQTVKILKIPRLQKRAGSSPAPGTESFSTRNCLKGECNYSPFYFYESAKICHIMPF